MVIELLALTIAYTSIESFTHTQTINPLLSPIPTQIEAIQTTQNTAQSIKISVSSDTAIPNTTAIPISTPTIPSATPPTTLDSVQPSNTPTPTPTPTLQATPLPTSIPIPTTKPTSTPTPPAPTNAPPTPTITPTPSPSPTPAVAGTSTDLNTLFTKYADEYKVDKDQLKRIAVCESNLNTNAKGYNSLYIGLYQFSEGTWISNRKQMKQNTDLTLRTNPQESIRTAAYMLSQGRQNAWPNCK